MKDSLHRLGIPKLAIALALTALTCGCGVPRHTVGLNQVLYTEIRKTGVKIENYRCTAGAHRGDSVAHLENSMDAFRAAYTNKAYAFIELDVQYSLDDQVVVFHDHNLRRLFKKGDDVGDRTYAQLLKLSNGQIATYEEVMSVIEGRKLNIEIKSQGDLDEDKRLVDYVIADITERHIKNDIVLSSISPDVVMYISEKYPKMPTGQIFWIKSSTYLPFDALTRNLYKNIGETQADYVMLHIANLRNIKDLVKLKPEGKTVVFWNFDDKMYVLHADLSDRMWGNSGFSTFMHYLRYILRRPKYRTISD